MTSIIKVDQIQNTSGTVALDIDSNGVLKQPSRPAFNAYRSTAGNVTYASGSIISADMTATNMNIGGHYKTSGADVGKFVVPFDGLYYFSMTLFNNTTTTLKRVGIFCSGSLNRKVVNAQGQSNVGDDFNGSGVIYLEQGDKVWITNSYNDTVIFHDRQHSLWSGFFLG